MFFCCCCCFNAYFPNSVSARAANYSHVPKQGARPSKESSSQTEVVKGWSWKQFLSTLPRAKHFPELVVGVLPMRMVLGVCPPLQG